MAGERDLARLLATMSPTVRPGEYVFVIAPERESGSDVRVLASIEEDEGRTVLITRADADGAGRAYDFVAGWIRLDVHSALGAVGLTAAVSTALAREAIACNVIAGVHHDHLLVPVSRVADAVRVLLLLSVPDNG